jgi:hypothetical protein
MADVPTIVSPIVQEDSKPRASRFFAKHDGKPAEGNRQKAKKDKHKSVKSSKKGTDRYDLLNQLLSPSLSRRMRYRLAKEIDVYNYSPIHPCELDLFSSPAVKISHFKTATKMRFRLRQCSLQKLRGNR